jgi:hypothetical protein
MKSESAIDFKKFTGNLFFNLLEEISIKQKTFKINEDYFEEDDNEKTEVSDSAKDTFFDEIMSKNRNNEENNKKSNYNDNYNDYTDNNMIDFISKQESLLSQNEQKLKEKLINNEKKN